MYRVATLALTLLLLLGAHPAAADVSSDAQEAYARILHNPTDYDANIRYSALMAQKGDYEAAIPPLERLLVEKPDNAWLQLQLGILYRSLGSPMISHTYLQAASANPQASADIKQRAAAMLQEKKG